MTKKEERMKLYKFLGDGFKTHYGSKTYRMGQWYKTRKPLKMCESGFHGSERIIDAFFYVQGEILCEVEVRGDSIKEGDKQCWAELKITRAWQWTQKDSVSLAVLAAELVIDMFEKKYPDDDRPRRAIKAAREWIENPSEENRAAARAAARHAARDRIFNAIEAWLQDYISELEEIKAKEQPNDQEGG